MIVALLVLLLVRRVDSVILLESSSRVRVLDAGAILEGGVVVIDGGVLENRQGLVVVVVAVDRKGGVVVIEGGVLENRQGLVVVVVAVVITQRLRHGISCQGSQQMHRQGCRLGRPP